MASFLAPPLAGTRSGRSFPISFVLVILLFPFVLSAFAEPVNGAEKKSVAAGQLSIEVDQVGYPLDGPKVALVSSSLFTQTMAQSFQLRRSSDSAEVFRGKLRPGGRRRFSLPDKISSCLRGFPKRWKSAQPIGGIMFQKQRHDKIQCAIKAGAGRFAHPPIRGCYADSHCPEPRCICYCQTHAFFPDTAFSSLGQTLSGCVALFFSGGFGRVVIRRHCRAGRCRR